MSVKKWLKRSRESMKPKPSSSQRQGSFLYQDLLEQLNPKVPLLLAKKIPWEKFEREFSSLYEDSGRPAKPVRLMVGLLLLKQFENMNEWWRPGCRIPTTKRFAAWNIFSGSSPATRRNWFISASASERRVWRGFSRRPFRFMANRRLNGRWSLIPLYRKRISPFPAIPGCG